MQLKTILNHVERYVSFVYQEARWADPETKTTIEIPLESRANGRVICSACGQAAPGYDRLAQRRFEFVRAAMCQSMSRAANCHDNAFDATARPCKDLSRNRAPSIDNLHENRLRLRPARSRAR